ncbi:uncharacterized protein SPSK_07120 [Sporothrix schenckii 1099-18]|uniref:Guanine nucleotide-exchange factor SEC12 n=1 Tax=Sporothrix schenckii 1099-18 TaxID=1397361 RepID=A0A0F2MI59_SPOSC|nr:uncharacterized protein SPSK_07120 [Sporothrix schenckii 1099-18]KJR88744.1 hypothetical protein SPSK_07120 [Sporothrix schenckii 1099-18]
MDIRTSQTTLDYPLYVCDFDPTDAGRLIVGGGGGASRTGVGNKITLINTSKPEEPRLNVTSEIELSKDEDSVTSFAAGPRRGRTTIAYAGVNSGISSLNKGRNDHFRVFGVDGPASASAKSTPSASSSKISELARAPFFTSSEPDADTYQRVVRVSAPFSDGQGSTLPQLGACATGLSQSPQIVLFDVTTAAPAATAPSAKSTAAATVLPKVRGRIDLSKDVADLDIIQTDAEQYQLAYCTDHELFLFNVATKGSMAAAAAALGGKRRNSSGSSTASPGASTALTAASATTGADASEEPYLAYEITTDAATGRTTRPTFRSIRYVTPRFILAVCNLPKRTGAFLLGLRLPDISPAVDGSGEQARITINVKLPKSITQATGLAVRNLTPPVAPGIRQSNGTQFVVAVAGGDNSLSLYTLEYQSAGSRTELLANLHPFRTLKDVHELPMTSIALSHFHTPTAPSTASTTAAIHYLRLASVSVKNTVVVHAIPLRKLPSSSATAPSTAAAAAAAAALNPPRYVVALKSYAPSGRGLIMYTFAVLALSVLIAHAILEVLGFSQPLLGAREIVPINWLHPVAPKFAANDRLTRHNAALKAAEGEWIVDDVPVAAVGDEKHDDFGAMPEVHPVAAFLSAVDSDEAKAKAKAQGQAQDAAAGQQVLIMRGEDSDHTIEVVTHDEAEHGPAVPWDDLNAAQQATWRQRLADAGHWTEAMGETVLRGVLFGELAGVVGAMVR